MAVLDALGFAVYNNISKRANSVTVHGAGTWAIGTYGPGGSPGIRANVDGGGVNGTQEFRITVADGGVTKYLEFGFKTNAAPSIKNAVAHFRDAGTYQISLILNEDLTISVYRGNGYFGGGTLLGTTSVSLALNTRYRIGWKVVANTSTGSSIIQINEIERLNISGVNTAGAGTTTLNVYAIGGDIHQDGQHLDYDNVVLSSDAFHGEATVLEDLPTGTGDADDGVATGAADTRQAVDDSTPDDDSTYSALQNVGDKFLLTFANLPSGVEVVACGALTWAEKSAAGTGKFKLDEKISGTEYLSSNEAAPSNASYAYFVDLSDVSPASSAAFTESEVNAMQVGIERTA